MTAPSEFERALGALYGLAIGDALGMPTQLLSPDELDRRFGAITWFQPAPDNHPIAAGLPAGHITDDTEQALLIARLLVDGRGRIDPLTLANALADWERDMVRRGSLDLLGPSTQRAISAVAAGISVEEAGRFGDTNGAAMRVTPVGIARPVNDFDGLLQAVVDASGVTHNTTLALAGASAVAAAVSAGVGGASLDDAIDAGLSAARLPGGGRAAPIYPQRGRHQRGHTRICARRFRAPASGRRRRRLAQMSPRGVARRRQRHHRCHHRSDRGLMPGNRCLSEGRAGRGENRQQPRARVAVRAIASASNGVWPWLRGSLK